MSICVLYLKDKIAIICENLVLSTKGKPYLDQVPCLCRKRVRAAVCVYVSNYIILIFYWTNEILIIRRTNDPL